MLEGFKHDLIALDFERKNLTVVALVSVIFRYRESELFHGVVAKS